MKQLRQLHLYLGCVFSPLILYFALSGAWQVFGFNDVPKAAPPSAVRSFLHELSKPHTHSTLPGASPRSESSTAFRVVALVMALALMLTTLLGIVLALRFTQAKAVVWLCLGLGVLVPVALIFLKG